MKQCRLYVSIKNMTKIAQDINLKLPIKEPIHVGYEIDLYGARYILSRYCGINLLQQPLKRISNVAWIHGWIPEFWNNTSPKMVTGHAMQYKHQLFLTNREDNASYLKSCGYTNVHAVGLPVVYLEKRRIERVRGSLLVMPAHSLDYTTHSHWKFEQYAQEIEKIAKYFKYVYVCVHPSCIKKGYWINEFQSLKA